jgi:hypothetical protein
MPIIYPYSSKWQATKTTRNIICSFVLNDRRTPKQNFVEKNIKMGCSQPLKWTNI